MELERNYLVCVLWLMLGISPQAMAQAEPESNRVTPRMTWVFVRHAEREGNKDELSSAGKKRAQQIARLAKLLKVSAVYSTDYKRTRDTAAPTCELLNKKLEIYHRTSPEWLMELEEKHSGRVILVVGHSNTTGALAGAAAERKGISIGHDDYDNLFIVQVDESGRSLVQLKFGD